MAWIQRLRGIADWLWCEARRRAGRRKRTSQGIHFSECDGQILPRPRQAIEADWSPQERNSIEFCSISVYPRQPWVLLELTGNAPKVKITIIVHFGYQRGLDVKGKSEKEKRAKRKGARAALWRARCEDKLTGHAICIDYRTSRRLIVEQLAICLSQENLLDGGIEEVLGFRSDNPVNQIVASELVRRFIDPAHPGSYPALKKKLRRDVAGPEAPKAVSGMVDQKNIDEDALTDEDRKKIPQEVAKTQCDCSVRHAAEFLGLSLRTLYQQIQNGALSIQHDRLGRIRLSASDLSKLCSRRKDIETKRDLACFLADRRRIDVRSARRHISRALKKGKTIDQIFTDARQNPQSD